MPYSMPFNAGMFGQGYGASSGRPAWVDEMIRKPEYDHPGLQPRGQMNTYLHQLQQTDQNAYNSLIVELAQKNNRLYKDWMEDQNRRNGLLMALRTKNDPSAQARSDYQEYIDTGRKRTDKDLRWWDRAIAKADEEQRQYASQSPAPLPRQEVRAEPPENDKFPASYGQEFQGDSIRQVLGVASPRRPASRDFDFRPGMAEPIQPSYGTPYGQSFDAGGGYQYQNAMAPPVATGGMGSPAGGGINLSQQWRNERQPAAPPPVDIRALLKEKGADPDSYGSDPNRMSPTRNWLNYWSSNSDGKVDPALQKQAQELKDKLSGARRAEQEAGLAQEDEMRRKLQFETAKKQAQQPAQKFRNSLSVPYRAVPSREAGLSPEDEMRRKQWVEEVRKLTKHPALTPPKQAWQPIDVQAAWRQGLDSGGGNDHKAAMTAYKDATTYNWKNNPELQAMLKKNKGKAGWRDPWYVFNDPWAY